MSEIAVGDLVTWVHQTGWPEQPEITLRGQVRDVYNGPSSQFVTVIDGYMRRFFVNPAHLTRIATQEPSLSYDRDAANADERQ